MVALASVLAFVLLGVAVDSAGSVYATSYGDERVAKVAVDQSHSTDLPYGNNRVLKVAES